MALFEFRRRWPSSFVTLISNYLGFLNIQMHDVERLTQALVDEAKYAQAFQTAFNVRSVRKGIAQSSESKGSGELVNRIRYCVFI